jgi:hypothetical protein
MKKLSPHDRTRQRQDGAERIDPKNPSCGKFPSATMKARAERGNRKDRGVGNVHSSARVPLFTHDEMLGVAARALASTFKKPKKKYQSK